MKHIFLSCFLAACTIASQAQVKIPAASTMQTTKQSFGLGTLEWSYSRPNLKGRSIYTDVAPAGKLWRTGANGPTTLTVTDEITIGGKKITTGKYGLLTIPDKSQWTVIISKQDNIGANLKDYKEADDVVRLKVKPVTIAIPTETFTIQLADVKSESAELQLRWGNIVIPVPIKTDVDSRIMASIDASMKSANPDYTTAAAYYLENGKDINKALEWYAASAGKNPKAFWEMYQYARALAKAGKKKEAKEMATKSMQVAKEAGNDEYVRNNQKLISSL